MENLYQLPGRPGYTPGTMVELAGPHDRYGRVVKALKEHYTLPNPCMVSGPRNLNYPCDLTLYLLRGTGSEAISEGQAMRSLALPVWGFTS